MHALSGLEPSLTAPTGVWKLLGTNAGKSFVLLCAFATPNVRHVRRVTATVDNVVAIVVMMTAKMLDQLSLSARKVLLDLISFPFVPLLPHSTYIVLGWR